MVLAIPEHRLSPMALEVLRGGMKPAFEAERSAFPQRATLELSLQGSKKGQHLDRMPTTVKDLTHPAGIYSSSRHIARNADRLPIQGVLCDR